MAGVGIGRRQEPELDVKTRSAGRAVLDRSFSEFQDEVLGPDVAFARSSARCATLRAET